MTYTLYITTSKGLEEVLASELTTIDHTAQSLTPFVGGVSCTGSLETAYRFCLYSRIANRVLLQLKTFPADTPESLYQGIRTIDWSEHFSATQTFCVDCQVSSSQITHSHYAALKIKDAIVDQFRDQCGQRPSVNTTAPDLRVNVYLQKNTAYVSLDLSGESLHKRGYRHQAGPAPLKENLAAALLWMANWPQSFQDLTLLDPMCGSGTFLIEAALIAQNKAPGLSRQSFGFEKWLGHVPALWKRLVTEAESKVIKTPKATPTIIGYDQDPEMIRLAQMQTRLAGVSAWVSIRNQSFERTLAPAPTGILVMNPPYGERLGNPDALASLYRLIGDRFKQQFKGWTAYVLCGNLEIAKAIHLKPSRRFVAWNGPIECRFLKFELY